MKKVIMFCLFVWLYSAATFAGTWIVENGTITGVVNTFNADQDGFILGVEVNGTPTSVVFRKSYFTSDENFKRAYATALTGLSMGSKVSIHEYVTGQPTYIAISVK